MNKSIYSNPEFTLLVHGEPVVLNISVEITLHQHEHTAKVIRCLFSQRFSPFVNYIFWKLGPVDRDVVYAEVVAALLDDITPSLYSLWHLGTIQPTVA